MCISRIYFLFRCSSICFADDFTPIYCSMAGIKHFESRDRSSKEPKSRALRRYL